jgi:hypothetical protein
MRQRVQSSFGKADAHHVDLFCRDTYRAFDRIQNAMKNRGTRLFVDAAAQEAHKRKYHGQYVIYSDDLTAGEWLKLLSGVGSADKRAEDSKAGDGVFDHAVVLPFDAADQKELAAVFGTDVSQSDARPRRSADPKADDKLAVGGVVIPGRMPTTSREVRQYIDSRRDRPDNAIAVLLVLRPVGG